MSNQNPIDVLDSVVTNAKWARQASRVLVAVRRIDEHDMETLERVVKEYGEIVWLLRGYDALTTSERRRLDDQYDGYVPSVLKDVLERLSASKKEE